MGGEKPAVPACCLNFPGSPPRGRGKEKVSKIEDAKVRITPAWAGKSLVIRRCSFPSGDHPRVGGEKQQPLLLHPVVLGSPPRGRGKEPHRTNSQDRRGITPAWAGKSLTIPKLTTRSWDHPRVGGEKSCIASRVQHRLGSPPRGRGKARFSMMHTSISRITPAWAGKSLLIWLPTASARDHPRVGGEKQATHSA